MTSRYCLIAPDSGRVKIPDSPVKFNGFQDDEIIINPEFNKSLKESLRQSKRRLMLFIDNNDEVNPVVEKPKLARLCSNDSEVSKVNKSSKFKNQPKATEKQIKVKESLGLKKDDLEYSIDGEEDVCICEIEPIPNYFYSKK